MKNIPRIEKVIFDSGPLLLALTLNYINKKNISNKDYYLKNAYDKLDSIQRPYPTFTNFFEKIHFYYSTPHVIGEVIGLVRSKLKLKDFENKFWDCSLDYLVKKKFSETLINILDLSKDPDIRPLIRNIGFVDSELIKYAHEIKLPIISIDKRTLKKEADKKNVDVLVIEDDIYRFVD